MSASKPVTSTSSHLEPAGRVRSRNQFEDDVRRRPVPPLRGLPPLLYRIEQIVAPDDTVDIEGRHEACPAHSLVVIGQRTVSRNVTDEHGRLADQVLAEILPAEARLRRVERRSARLTFGFTLDSVAPAPD